MHCDANTIDNSQDYLSRMEVSGKSDCVSFITIFPMPSPEPGSGKNAVESEW